MRLTTVLAAAAALTAGCFLVAAAGRGRYRKITAAAAAAASTAMHHPRVEQLLFDLAGRASSNAARIPGPGADIVDTAATHLQDALTQPDHKADRTTSAPAAPISERRVA